MPFDRKKLMARIGVGAFRRLQSSLAKRKPQQAERIGERIGRAGFRFSKKHRNRCLENLRLAFPDWSEEQRTQVAKRVFEHFGRVAVDFIRLEKLPKEEVVASLEMEGRENLEAALAQGKGVLLMTAHFGNWERSAHWFGANGLKLSVVARDANNPEMNQVVLQMRQSAGMDVISRGAAAPVILRNLKKNECIGILADQNNDETFAPFFGKMCGTVMGPAVISLRTGAPMLMLLCARIAADKFRIFISKPLEPEAGFEGTPEGLMRAYNLALEQTIREYPDQYLWIHDRWKSARRRGML